MTDVQNHSLAIFTDEFRRETIEKLDLIAKILKESREESCNILCKTPQGHQRNLKKARDHAKKIKEQGPKNALDKYLISLLD